MEYLLFLLLDQLFPLAVVLANTVHYSFDFAQQVHYPHNPLQPGPMYFKTARKCAVFGICCEGIPRQINYLIDEASDVGKGANTVISLLHHFFEHHGLGEVSVGLHADNCVGQNENNAVLQVHACTIQLMHTNAGTCTCRMYD